MLHIRASIALVMLWLAWALHAGQRLIGDPAQWVMDQMEVESKRLIRGAHYLLPEIEEVSDEPA